MQKILLGLTFLELIKWLSCLVYPQLSFILFIITFVLNLILSLYIIYKNPNDLLKKWVFLLLLSNAISSISITDFMLFPPSSD